MFTWHPDWKVLVYKSLAPKWPYNFDLEFRPCFGSGLTFKKRGLIWSYQVDTPSRKAARWQFHHGIGFQRDPATTSICQVPVTFDRVIWTLLYTAEKKWVKLTGINFTPKFQWRVWGPKFITGSLGALFHHALDLPGRSHPACDRHHQDDMNHFKVRQNLNLKRSFATKKTHLVSLKLTQPHFAHVFTWPWNVYRGTSVRPFTPAPTHRKSPPTPWQSDVQGTVDLGTTPHPGCNRHH